jgi:GH18 family chitinase
VSALWPFIFATSLIHFRQHDVVPDLSLVSDVTHVALAFMSSSIFNAPDASAWPLFTSVESVREKFPPDTAVMVAIGGWGNTDGFSVAAASDDSRKLFASNIRKMVDQTGADGDRHWHHSSYGLVLTLDQVLTLIGSTLGSVAISK